MLRLPAHVRIGPYTFHLDVLAARMRWRRVRHIGHCALLLLVLVTGVGIGFPFARGTGVIVILDHDPLTKLSLNGQALTSNVLRVSPGRHVLRIERTGTFAVDQTIQVTKEQTTTLTLPVLRPIPRVQRLPLPYPQSKWTHVESDVSGGWRISATQPTSEDSANVRPGWGAMSDTRLPRTLLHMDKEGITPLSVLETYRAADEIVTPEGNRFWALWEAQGAASRAGVVGVLSLTTPSGTQTLSTTAALSGLWWSPGGRVLLVAIARDHLVDLALVDPQHLEAQPLEPIITVPSAIQSVNWHPDGRAVVVASAANEVLEQSQTSSRPTRTPQDHALSEPAPVPRSAVLIQLSNKGIRPQAIRLHSPPTYPAGILSLDWSTEDLWWVANTGLGLALEQFSLSDDTTRRVGELPENTVAFTVLPDGTVRLIRSEDEGQLVVERWPEAVRLFTLPDVVANDAVGGIWRDGELVLATTENELWYVHIQPEALQ